MECPSCGTKVMAHHQTCVKCGESLSDERTGKLGPGREVPVKESRLAGLRYLREFVPPPGTVRGMLPHPANWVLGIGLPVVVCLALVIPLFAPSKADHDTELKLQPGPTVEKSVFDRCIADNRAQADDACGKIVGTAQGLRRVTCQVAKLAAGYTSCTADKVGTFGSCLKRCGQSARTCSATCAIVGAKSWTDTAKCVVPCWKTRLDACLGTCF